MHRRLIAAAVLAVTACAEPTDIVVPEPEIRPSGAVSLDGFSFFFPVGLTFEGATETCPNRASECPVGDDSTHAVWRAGELRFDYVLDPYGGVPMGDDWGEPITINGRPAFRKQLEDGGTRYLITNHYGGEESAAVAIWQHEEEPVFWGTCHNEADCDAVLQTLASVSMRSAESECRLMFPQPAEEWVPPPGYRPTPVPFPAPPAPRRDAADMRPPAPPPPPAPRPPGAEQICQEYLDAS